MIDVTEIPTVGYQLTSIQCTETSDAGTSISDTTVDLASGKAYIVAQAGEAIDCTFTSQPIAPTAADASISGRISTPSGQGARGIYIKVVDAQTGEARSAITNTFGYYLIDGLQVGRLYVISVQDNRRYAIQNGLRSFTLDDNLSNMDFVAAPR